MMKYTSLFLDLDNTLLDFDKSEHRAVKLTLAYFGLPHDDSTAALYAGINKEFWERFERGEIPKTEIFTGRFEKLLQALDAKGDPGLLSENYSGRLADGHDTVEGAPELLAYLKGRGYRLYATTNGLSSTQYKRIRNSKLEGFFDAVFVSEEAGHQKPEREYFTYIIDRIPEKELSKILIVGDSQSSDILGGINAGIDTCWYNPKGAEGRFPATYEIGSLKELEMFL